MKMFIIHDIIRKSSVFHSLGGDVQELASLAFWILSPMLRYLPFFHFPFLKKKEKKFQPFFTFKCCRVVWYHTQPNYEKLSFHPCSWVSGTLARPPTGYPDANQFTSHFIYFQVWSSCFLPYTPNYKKKFSLIHGVGNLSTGKVA